MANKKLYCEKCGTENNHDAFYCVACGAPLVKNRVRANSRPDYAQTALSRMRASYAFMMFISIFQIASTFVVKESPYILLFGNIIGGILNLSIAMKRKWEADGIARGEESFKKHFGSCPSDGYIARVVVSLTIGGLIGLLPTLFDSSVRQFVRSHLKEIEK